MVQKRKTRCSEGEPQKGPSTERTPFPWSIPWSLRNAFWPQKASFYNRMELRLTTRFSDNVLCCRNQFFSEKECAMMTAPNQFRAFLFNDSIKIANTIRIFEREALLTKIGSSFRSKMKWVCPSKSSQDDIRSYCCTKLLDFWKWILAHRANHFRFSLIIKESMSCSKKP